MGARDLLSNRRSECRRDARRPAVDKVLRDHDTPAPCVQPLPHSPPLSIPADIDNPDEDDISTLALLGVQNASTLDFSLVSNHNFLAGARIQHTDGVFWSLTTSPTRWTSPLVHNMVRTPIATCITIW